MKWEEIAIGEVCKVGRGSSPRPISDKAYFDGGQIPWIKIADATNSGKVIFETKEHVNSYGASYSRLLPEGSLILATSGVSLGQVKFLGMEGCIHDGWLYLDDFKNFDRAFMYYVLIGLTSYFHSQSYGAAIQNINTDILRETKIPNPPLPTQQKIASILSTYDDLIENNLKRIRLLEEAAQNLYREWFVKFRFPGWEEVKMVNGLPEGWQRKKIKDLCDSIDYGYTASATSEKSGAKFLRITDIVPFVIDWESVPYCEIPEDKIGKYELQEGDIVVARTGATVGYAKRLNKRHEKSVFASYLVRFKLKEEIENRMIGVFMESDLYKSYVTSHVGGAAQPNANAQVLAGATLAIPPKHIQEEFKNVTETIFDQKEILQQQNQKIKTIRDLLLPRLMNQTIEV